MPPQEKPPKTESTFIHPVRISAKHQTRPTDAMATAHDKNLDSAARLPIHHASVTKVRGESDLGNGHAPFNLRGEFFALFDAGAKDMDAGFECGEGLLQMGVLC